MVTTLGLLFSLLPTIISLNNSRDLFVQDFILEINQRGALMESMGPFLHVALWCPVIELW